MSDQVDPKIIIVNLLAIGALAHIINQVITTEEEPIQCSIPGQPTDTNLKPGKMFYFYYWLLSISSDYIL